MNEKNNQLNSPEILYYDFIILLLKFFIMFPLCIRYTNRTIVLWEWRPHQKIIPIDSVHVWESLLIIYLTFNFRAFKRW